VRNWRKDVSLVQEVIIQDVRPHIIEALHVLIIPISQVEADTIISQKARWYLLHGVTLEVEKYPESIENLSFICHSPELLT
jgi:hypothetical protein